MILLVQSGVTLTAPVRKGEIWSGFPGLEADAFAHNRKLCGRQCVSAGTGDV